MATPTAVMSYTEIRAWSRQHPLRLSEIPTEHAVSLPVPTLRWGEPAYAFFAAPAGRPAGGPARQEAPDRWWAFRAQGGQVLVYALTRVVPFGPGSWGAVDEVPAGDSLAVIQQLVRDIEQMMDASVADFFAGRPGDGEVKAALAGVLARFLPPALLERYRALAPDFFAWLGPPSPARS